MSSQKKKIINKKIFFRRRHLNMDVLKHFLFPTIDFKRDIIPAKI